jgi:hypothetical protein
MRILGKPARNFPHIFVLKMPKIARTLLTSEAVVSLQEVTPGFFRFVGTGSRRAVGLAVSMVALAFLSACGSSNSITTTVTCPGATGNFNNASLPAGSQWTYQLSGWFISSTTNAYAPYTAAGVFTVDGKGNIASGFDDGFGSNITGTYSISGNGTGSMTVRLNSGAASGNSLSWAVTLSSTNPGSIYLIEADQGFNSSGVAYQQTTSAFSAAPSGTFVFRTHVLTAGTALAGSAANVGVMTVSSGAITGLNADVLLGGLAPSQRTLGTTVANPAFTVPDATGTGTVTFADSQGTSYTYLYYVIDGQHFLLFDTNTGLGLGRMEAQSVPAGGFTNAALKGGYIVGSRGDTTASSAGGVNSVGQFTADGKGNVTGGSYDTVRDGSASLNAAITSSGTASVYSVAANGRTTVTLNAGGTVVQQIMYLVSGSRGFFLVSNDTSRVEDGTLEQQAFSAGTTSFSGSDFKGQSAFVMGGSIAGTPSVGGAPLDRTGTLTSDGNGNLGWAEVVNSGGTINAPGCLGGTYTVATNGRAAASVNSLSGNLVFYMVSPNKAYLLQGDSSTKISGGSAVQLGSVVNPPGGF